MEKLPAIIIKGNTEKLTAKEEDIFDPYEMSESIYNRIVAYVESSGLKNKKAIENLVNHLFNGKRNLYKSYILYGKYKKKLQLREYKEKKLKELNEYIENMKEYREFGLSIKPQKQKANRGKKEHPHKEIFDWLDLHVPQITELIYLGCSPKQICLKLGPFCAGLGLSPMVFHHWKDETEHIDELQYAYKCSAEEHMNRSSEFMREWLANPDLTMQHVGIVREIGLWHSRMAEFLDRKRWGRKIEITNDQPQRKVLDGKDINKVLQKLGDAIKKAEDEENGKEFEEEDLEDEDDLEQEDKEEEVDAKFEESDFSKDGEEFIDFEEIKE